MKKLIVFLGFTALLLLNSCNEPGIDSQKSTIVDVFAIPPTDSSLLFAPGIVSQGLYERDIAISPDYNELFFGILTGKVTTIMQMKKENNEWTAPQVAPFANDPQFFFLEPALSPDGKRLYFLSTKPRIGEDTLQGWANQNIWYVDKLDDGIWSEMKDLPDHINTDGGEFFPSLSNNGNLYFTWNAKDSRKSYVKKAEWIDGKFMEAVFLPENVCGEGEIYNACISPDESYLIGCATGRDESSQRAAQYYVFFNLGEGKWSDAISLGETVNLPGTAAISPSITRDGKYLFFASDYIPDKSAEDKILNASKIYSTYNHPQNGLMDIYWIKTDFIEKLYPSVENPNPTN
ncbi:MAG: hypothetical protein K9H49_12255 [Bacteroidales bacterium]|nr:hypothetical protein [Bacteroidales bacterium]MCF8390659.1 hypothetical protein [Bacteroidales bacterium]